MPEAGLTPGSESGRKVRVLIADDHSIIRRIVRSTLQANPHFEVCGEAENGAVAVERVKELNPDVVVLDLQMPVMNGIEAARQISIVAPNTTMVMFTMHCSEQLVKEAQAAGIREVVSKSSGFTGHLLTSLKNLRSNR